MEEVNMELESTWESGRVSVSGSISTSFIGIGGTLNIGDFAVYITLHFLVFHLMARIDYGWTSNL